MRVEIAAMEIARQMADTAITVFVRGEELSKADFCPRGGSNAGVRVGSRAIIVIERSKREVLFSLAKDERHQCQKS